MDKEKLWEYYSKHRGGFNGAVIGFILALFVLFMGFIKTLFIAICVLLGYYIGKRFSEDKNFLKNLLDKVLPPGTYR